MTNRQPNALENLYRGWARQMEAVPELGIPDIRRMFEHWGDVTAEPDAVHYAACTAGSVPALWAVPEGCSADRVLLCCHGGGYVLGSMQSHRKLYGHFAKSIGCRALILDYRRAPEHPHPAQVDDLVAAYAWLLQHEGFLSSGIAFLGDSAGGALAISGLLRARARKMPLPAAAVSLAPYLDTEALGDSYETNAAHDLLGSRTATLQFMKLFLGPRGDPKDPLANPLFADLAGLPPLLIQVGGHDVLLDDSRRFAARAQQAGVDVTLDITPCMQHVFHFLAGNEPEADAAIAAVAKWVRPRLGLTGAPAMAPEFLREKS